MSDGPYKSLPMTRKWKRVAELSDNAVWESGDVADALVDAMERDAAVEIGREFARSVADLFRSPRIFAGELESQLECLRFGCTGMQSLVIDKSLQLLVSGLSVFQVASQAVEQALGDRAARGARQVEEHYCRKSSQHRASAVRGTIEQAIADVTAARRMRQVAERLIRGDSKPRRQRKKRSDLDDGVRL